MKPATALGVAVFALVAAFLHRRRRAHLLRLASRHGMSLTSGPAPKKYADLSGRYRGTARKASSSGLMLGASDDGLFAVAQLVDRRGGANHGEQAKRLHHLGMLTHVWTHPVSVLTVGLDSVMAMVSVVTAVFLALHRSMITAAFVAMLKHNAEWRDE